MWERESGGGPCMSVRVIKVRGEGEGEGQEESKAETQSCASISKPITVAELSSSKIIPAYLRFFIALSMAYMYGERKRERKFNNFPFYNLSGESGENSSTAIRRIANCEKRSVAARSRFSRARTRVRMLRNYTFMGR